MYIAYNLLKTYLNPVFLELQAFEGIFMLCSMLSNNM